MGNRPKDVVKAQERAAAIYSYTLRYKILYQNTTIRRYFQSWKYFSDYFKETKYMLSFSNRTFSMANKRLEHIRESNPGALAVGVHLRIIDGLGYAVFDSGFIKRAMDYFREK